MGLRIATGLVVLGVFLGMEAAAQVAPGQPYANPAGSVYGQGTSVSQPQYVANPGTAQPAVSPTNYPTPTASQPYALQGQQTTQTPVQTPQPYGPAPAPGNGPNQPVLPQSPTVHPANGAPTTLPPPFTLTSEDEAQMNQVLADWERSTAKVKDFSCKFRRQQFDVTFQNKMDPNYDPKKPTREDKGEMRYGAPDRGMYRVDGESPEKWICDGRSIFEYNFQQKVLTEHKLPQHLWGKAISDGPLPFLFGQSPAKIKHRYYTRLITPDAYKAHQVWIQAFPRFSADAANFNRAELVLSLNDKMPLALRVFSTNGVDNTVHYFSDPVVNNLLAFLSGDPFKPGVDRGWTREVKEAPSPQGNPAAQAASQPGPGQGRR